MYRNPVLLYKTLVIGVIVLFIGVGIQPAFAVTPNISASEDDCDTCPKVSKPHLVRLKSLIKRLDTLNNKLSVVSKHNPEVEDKYQDISDSITTLTEMNKELKSDTSFDNYPIICSNLFIITFTFFLIGEFFSIIYEYLNTLLFLPIILASYFSLVISLYFYIGVFECEEWNSYKLL